MRLLSRFLSAVTLLALMSAPVVRAQTQDDQSYNQDQATQPAPQYDQPASPQQEENPQYDAQNGQQSNTPDPPARAARLQYMTGSISVQPQGTGDWITGQLNRPLTNSDNIWADKNSRAELSVGAGLIRIDSETSLTLTNIGENAVQLELHQGAMYLHVRRLYDGETYEVDTANQAFTVQKPGDYRFDVDSDGDKTVITVWRGSGESTGDGPSVHIESNQQARFYDGTSLKHDIHAAPSADDFDQWAFARDQKLDHSESARYVSPEVPGYEDLDEYGTWRNTPDYGEVWAPTVPPGWAPYYNGNWIWQNPWGWTWVESEPWGYAPFHYGRWVWAGGYWGWAPGPIWVRPYYAPALVAWFGGPGWGINFGFGFGGGFGWCPLGFGEPFIPWYHAGFGYFNRVNVTNTRITNINIRNVYNNNFANGQPRSGGGIYGARNGNQVHYANLRAPGGFSAASRNTLVNSLSVAHNGVRVSPNQLSRTSLASVRTPGVQPTRTTMLGGAGRGTAAPARSFSRPIMSRMTPLAVNRGSLATTRNSGNPSRGTRPSNIGRTNIGTNNMGRPVMGATEHGAIGRGSVPRPSAAPGMSRSIPQSGVRPTMGARSTAPEMRPQSLPRPSSVSVPRGGEQSIPRGPSGNIGSTAPRSNGPRSQMSVPRPPNSTSPSAYSARAGSYQPSRGMSSDGGGYSRPAPSYGRGAYSRPSPSYGGSNGHSAQPYGAGPYARSMPSYGGGYSRSAPPSYGGGLGSRAPSYGNRSYGGFGGGHTPSYGGARSSGSFGGGGHASGGSGGGHVSAGGGGHSSGGGGGHSSGGGHAGHH
jgi:uncharacterized protein DUF6600/FecR-like protein